MAQPLLPQARRELPRPHDLRDRGRRGARRDARHAPRHRRRAVPGREADRLLGHERDRVEPAPVEPRAGGQAARREADRDRPVPLADRGEVPPAHRADAGHRRRLRARRDPRAGRARAGSTAITSSATRWASTRSPSARARSTRTASRRCAGSPPTTIIGFARDYWTLQAGGDPPQLRHAAHARRRQRGARGGQPAGAGRALARSGRRTAAVDERRVPVDEAALYRPDLLAGRRPRTINMSTIGRDLLDGRPADRGADRLRQQPGGGRAAVVRGGARLRARGPVHGRARAVPDRHGGLRRLRAAGDDAARARRRAQVLRALLHARQQSGDRSARRGAAEQRDLPPARRAHGFRRTVLRRERRRTGGTGVREARARRRASTGPT